jgi:NAD(P)-dependent dehydrogenase (short-subunit alcohol dehydrogenase family)
MNTTPTNKVALITGANRSIGKEIARQLSQQNITVIIGSRDPIKGEAAATELRSNDAPVVAVQLDVTDQASIDKVAAYITAKYGKLDILINNAGVATYEEMDKISFNAFQQTYAVNVFGIVQVTEAMLPLLKKASKSRVINLSSEMASLKGTQDPKAPAYNLHLPAYNSSKTAVNAMTIQFAKVLQNDGIVVNAVDPGYTDTDLNNHTGIRSVEESAKSVVWLALVTDSQTGKFFFDTVEADW